MNKVMSLHEAKKAKKAAESSERDLETWGYDVEEMNEEWAVVLMGAKAVILRESTDGPIEDNTRLLQLDAFKTWFSNRFTEIRDTDNKVKVVTWAKAWLNSSQRRQYPGIEFHPDPNNEPGTPGYYNLWRGFALTPDPKAGTYRILKDHLLNNICNGDEDLYRWVFGWFAHMIQKPRERIGTALVLRGGQGAGKSKVGEIIGSLFPGNFFLVDDARYLTGQFNMHMASCLLLQADEAVWAGDKNAEGRLRGLITSNIQMVEPKGIDAVRLSNYVHVMMTSNHDWVVPAGKDERRFCVLDVSNRCAQNHDYFREMDEEMENGGRQALLADLLAFDLDSVNLRQVPRTEALLEQKLHSLDPIDSWWLDRLMSGKTARGQNGWLDAIPTNLLTDDYAAATERVGIRRKSTETALGARLRKMVPGLKRVRIWWDYPDGTSRREWCYQLPALAECRAAFDAMIKQPVHWDDPEDVPVRENE